MKKLLYFHLKNIIYFTFSLDAFLFFLLLHQYSATICTQNKDVINGIADGVILAILLSLISLLINNCHHLSEMKKNKESVNNILLLSLLKFVYGKSNLPDISQVSMKNICEKIIQTIDTYQEEQFTEFQYAIQNDYNAIIQNISVVAKIDSMHSFTYGILVSNLNALIKQWKDFEEKFKKYNLDHPINNKTKYYNLFIQSKGYIKIYIDTCLKFDKCEFEEYSANYK